jgi:flavin reductase (DIM6/NTAB) family NADH-FMN oxidoreductase RutF
MKSITIKPSILYFGTPVALLTTLNTDGSSNISAFSSAWALVDRVVLGLSAEGQGFRNLERQGEAVIHLPAAEMFAAVERIAATTGRYPVPDYKKAMGYEFVANKFAMAGWSEMQSRILECPLQLEAKVLAIHACTDDGTGKADECRIVEMQVLQVHAHQQIVVPNTNYIDPKKWSPLWYVFRHYFGHAKDMGANFRAEV